MAERLNLHLLRLFATVAEQSSFSRAAEVLAISQPAVSKGVRELESQLDLSLLERSSSKTTGVKLTEAGTALLDHARGIFAMERVALEDVRARVGLRRGRLDIGASTTVASYWLPQFIARFTARFPGLQFKLHVGNTQWVSQQLIECAVDLALVEGPVDDPRIAQSHWRDEALSIVVGPYSPLLARRPDARRLSAQRWIMREPGSGTGEVMRRLCVEHGIEVRDAIELASNEAIARAVAADAGLSILPLVVVEDLASLDAIRLLDTPTGRPLTRPLSLLHLRGRPLSPSAQGFRVLLQEAADSLRAQT